MALRNEIIAVALLVLMVGAIGGGILTQSAAYDEPAVLAAGADLLNTGRLSLDHVYPPVMKYLTALALLPAQPDYPPDEAIPGDSTGPYRYGFLLLYRNKVMPEVLLAWGRLPSLCLSLLGAVLVWKWASLWYGPTGGLVALGAYVAEPNLLAHGGLATTDIGVSVFLLATLYFFALFLEGKDRRFVMAAGLAAGLAAMAKSPGHIAFVWGLGILSLAPIGILGPRRSWRSFGGDALIFVGSAAAVIAGLYQIRYLPLYGDMLRETISLASPGHPMENYHNFLHGEWRQGKGWRGFYLIALAVKTTLPFQCLVLTRWLTARRDALRAWILWVPIITYVAIFSMLSKQSGVRYILPIFPLLCVWIGGLGSLSKVWTRGIVIGLLCWSGIETSRVAPRFLAYFNQIAGGPKGGYRWLVEAGLDLGQDFPAIRRSLDKWGPAEIVVAVLGNGDRDYYFGPHQDLISERQNEVEQFRHINSTNPVRELLVVSASILQGYGLSNPGAFSWLRGMTPLDQPGFSSFIYDITFDALSHFRMALIYTANGHPDFAEREFRRTTALAPERSSPWLAWGDLALRRGDMALARRLFTRALVSAQKSGDAASADMAKDRLQNRFHPAKARNPTGNPG